MTETVRETKRADELKTGDWLAATQIDGDGDRPTKVLDVHPFTDTERQAVLLVYRTQNGRPASCTADAAELFRLATEAEVRASQDDVRREHVAAQLRQLADLIVDKRLPLPGPYELANVTFHFGRQVEAVDRVAELLGTERTTAYGTTTVKLPSTGKGLLSIGWDAYAPKAKPAADPVPVASGDPTGLAYTRADDEADDPTPVSPGRVPLHTGGLVDGGQLVDEPLDDDELVWDRGSAV
jgi:hypothetical protein